MSLVTQLIGFGLRQVIGDHADNAVQVIEVVKQRFRDHSQTLPKALERAHDRAWQSLGVALAGPGLLDRIKVLFASGDDKGIREQVQLFLKDNAFSFDGTPDSFRGACLDDLKRLRKSGLLSTQSGSPADFARLAAGFKRHADAQGLVEESRKAVAGVADALVECYPNLARLIRRPTPAGPPLLAAAFCYFFRREVEQNEELAHGLMFDGQQRLFAGQKEMLGRLEQLSASQATALGEVGLALDGLGERFDQAIEEVLRELERTRQAAEAAERAAVGAQKTAAATHGAVLDLQAELQRVGGLHLANADEVRALLEQVLLHLSLAGMQKGEVRPGNSCSIRGEDERRAVKSLLARFRQLPAGEQKQVPALLNGLGKLQVGAGDFAEARRTFAEVVAVVPDATGKAEASYNAYRAALEERKLDTALGALREAAALDAIRFAPFPLHRYEPKRILGAGGFGTAILCHDRNFDEEVVVKTLHAADLERGLDDVFREARTLRRLSHPTIIGVRDCEYADPLAKARPYLVMDYFAGATLEDHVRDHGPLAVADLLAVAGQIARGMQAAHGQGGVLHRDLKPANVLVRKEGDGWQARIIDFGLALRKQVVETSMAGRSAGNTILSDSVAGTLKYAPPEQMGRMPGVKPGTYSDVYAFGKTCCYALFRTTEPKSRHWSSVPRELAEMLERCTDEELEHRHAGFEAVLAVLGALDLDEDDDVEEEEIDDEDEEVEEEEIDDDLDDEDEEVEEEEIDDDLDDEDEEVEEEEIDDEDEEVEEEDDEDDDVEEEDLDEDEDIEEGDLDDEEEDFEYEEDDLDRSKERRAGEIVTVLLRPGSEMKFAWVPPGTFLMGSPASELQREDDETQHRVTLTKGFYLGTHQVTQAQWWAVMGNNPSEFKGDALPVENVSWDDCQEFVKRLGQKTSKRFRLPTEAEWEYACRAGTTTPFHFGETISTDQANYDGNYTYGQGKKGDFREITTPGGSFPANAWGLHDMHGNVLEWCQDWFGPYPKEDQKDPVGSNTGIARVLRGGSWFNDPRNCRSACRSRVDPGVSDDDCGCRLLLFLD